MSREASLFPVDLSHRNLPVCESGGEQSMEELNDRQLVVISELVQMWQTGRMSPSLRQLLNALDNGDRADSMVQDALANIVIDLDKYGHKNYAFASQQAFSQYLIERIRRINQAAHMDADREAEARTKAEKRASIPVPLGWPHWLAERYRDAIEAKGGVPSLRGEAFSSSRWHLETCCWNCHQTISTFRDFDCPICHTILCRTCGACKGKCLRPKEVRDTGVY